MIVKKLPDVIQILPDAVANRIAAGEVVQRPASVVKELLENSIDAGATSIKLVIKEGGKSLIQVSDNGKGMSDVDARMCFERHATSKIRDTDDIFHITTKGFRGEALASIAAVAKVELKTKTEAAETGVKVVIEGSDFITQEPCAMTTGTVFTIKSLFYNVPARRKFLKSDPVEARHIIDEFTRVALAHPEVAFEMINNDSNVFKLEVGTLRQRIVGILGSNYNNKLVPVAETTDIVTINGFVIKPEFSKKTKGDQFFFVNNRFIRSPFLNHAIESAFEGLLTKDSHPGYFVFMEVNPSDIDINIHPSKTEIKFTDERSIYQILRSSIKQALGKFNIAPSLDFDRDPSFDFPQPKDYTSVKIPSVNFNPDYNPFKENSGAKHEFQRPEKSERDTNNLQNWQKLYKDFDDFSSGKILPEKDAPLNFSDNVVKPRFFVIGAKYIVTYIRSGLVIIDQHRAHERILFEKFEKAHSTKQALTQNQLFPQTYEINSADFELLKEMIEELKVLGFDLDLFGKNTVVVRGVPALSKAQDVKALLDEVLEQYKNNVKSLKLPKNTSLLQSMASGMAIRSGQNLSDMEIDALIADLFACENPYHAPNGKPTMVNISTDELDAKFLKS